MIGAAARTQAPIRFDSFPLRGGLDTATPQLSLKPGVARDALNWECSINGGYSRIVGYERYDGRPSPAAAVVNTLGVTATAGLAVGNTINGATSGATGVVAYIDGLTVVFTKSTGAFVAAEDYRVGAAVIGVVSAAGVIVTDQTKAATYQDACSSLYRADILAVPGVGAILGVFVYQGTLYAWRSDGTHALLYRASAGGWTLVAFKDEVSFTVGSVAPVEGASITQGAVSAVVRRVVVQSGSWGSGTAAGRIIIETPTGGNFAAGALTGGGTATLTGAQTAISLLPGGRFEHDVADAGNGERVYGADGVNRCFEFDGTLLVPIATGNTVDNPLHIKVHHNYVFISLKASVQFSGVGDPYNWTSTAGAGEVRAKQTVNGFVVMQGAATTAALMVLMENYLQVLYGTSPTDFQLAEFNIGYGGKAYSQQTLTQAFAFSDIGVFSLANVQAYGNFAPTTLTNNIRSFTQQRRTLVSDSIINREKSQYRLFFNDGYGLYITIVNGKLLGCMPVLFTDPVEVACNAPSSNGIETSYFGSTNGFVYALDVGRSFDGGAISSYVDLAFAAQGNVRVTKRYRRAVFEMQGAGYSEFAAGFTLSYGNTDVSQGNIAAPVSPVYWDRFTFDQFIWDGRAIAPSQMSLDGSAENIAIRFEQNSSLWPSVTINSITLQYTPRRILRGA